MAIVKEDDKKESPDEAVSEDAEPKEDPPAEKEAAESSLAKTDAPPAEAPEASDEPVNAAAPMQLGTRRYVYAAYFAGAIAVIFLADKVLDIIWYRLNQWKPTTFGEPVGEYEIGIAALIGIGALIYSWRRGRTRKLAEEVATELSKVTWPGRTEVVNSTVITIVTTLVATVFFALMDRFWGFVTNLVYGT